MKLKDMLLLEIAKNTIDKNKKSENKTACISALYNKYYKKCISDKKCMEQAKNIAIKKGFWNDKQDDIMKRMICANVITDYLMQKFDKAENLLINEGLIEVFLFNNTMGIYHYKLTDNGIKFIKSKKR